MMEDDDTLNISLRPLIAYLIVSDQVFTNEAEKVGVTLIAVKMFARSN